MTSPLSRVEHIGDARTIIYAFCEPLPNWKTGPVRYVGKTINLPSTRLKHGIRAAKRNPRLPIHWWLKKQIEAGLPQHIIWLESVKDGADWAARERFWIDHFKSQGCDLLNMTEGGEGLPGHKFSASHKAKISAALKTGSWFSCLKCGAPFWRKLYAIRQGEAKYCSRSCSNGRHK